MKKAYPVLLTPDSTGYTVYIPDFDANTQGESLPEAIEMARDAIGLMGIDYEDDGKQIPEPNPGKIKAPDGSLVSLVDVDFTDYRRRNDMRAVRKNCSLPGWLCYEAEKADINFSQTLKDALIQELRLAK